MVSLRRIVSLVLMLAFAGYGMAVAPAAHAHAPSSPLLASMLHAVALDVDRNHHDDHDHGHDHHSGVDDHADDHPFGTGSEGPDDHAGLHSHVVPSFLSADEAKIVVRAVASELPVSMARSRIHVRGMLFPLMRPPRAAV